MSGILKKRLFFAVLIILLLLVLFPANAFAENVVDSGYCGGEGDGTNLSWRLDTDGTLTISGKGEMAYYNYYSSPAPWIIYISQIRSLVIGNDVTSIGDCAFYHCDGLESIMIPNNVKNIEYYAFYHCENLKSAIIGSGVTKIKFGSFSYCYSLENVSIGSNVTEIENEAFYYSGLKSVTIPNGVKSIGEKAFSCCESLVSIALPSSLKDIGVNAFKTCKSLEGFTVDEQNPYYFADSNGVLFNKDKTEMVHYPTGNSRISYSIPEGVKSIAPYAFSECTVLESVVLPKSMTDISDYAFYEFGNLKTVAIPSTVTSIGHCSFMYCESLENITIPSSVTKIKDAAFFECRSLSSIKIPDSVTSIEPDAFQYCRSLTSVTIGNGITEISNGMFSDCYNLTSIRIPNGITSIGIDAFANCGSLKDIYIPESMKSIGFNSFYKCYKLNDVYYSGTEAQWNELIKTYDYYIPYGDMILYAAVHFNSSGVLNPSQSFIYGDFADLPGAKLGVFEYKTNKPLRDADISYSGKHLKISLSGYESVDISGCTVNTSRCNAFALVPSSLGAHISAVHCDGKDALVNEVKILSSTKAFDLYVYGSGAKYQLFSDFPSLFDGNKIAESADGHFSVNPASLTKGKSLYVRAVDADGKAGAVIKTNIRVKEAFNGSTKLTNKFGFTVPDDVPILGGSDFSIDIAGLCPVSYTQEGNTIRFGLGCKESLLSKDNSANWLNFKKAVDKMCSGWQEGSSMYTFAKAFGAPIQSSGAKFNTEFYGYCEVNLADDGSVSSWGGRLAMVVKGGWESQWQTVVVAVPVVIKFSAEASLGASFSIGLDINNASLYMNGEATLTLPKIRLSGGIGIAYVADVSVYGSGENKIKYVTSKQGQRITGTLSGEMGVGLSALCFSYDIPLLKGDWEYLNTGLFRLQSAKTVSEIANSVLDGENYHFDRSYADTQSVWYTEKTKRPLLMASGSNAASETTVQRSVYYSAEPQLVITDDGTRVIVWTADIPSRSDGNHLAAVYSVYDKERGVWSAPVIVNDDGTLDSNVSAAAYGNKVYMAWSDAKSADFTADTAMTDMAAALEISAAVYDTETGCITVSRLTDNAFADLRPMLCADENGIYAAWVENSNADLLRMSGTNNILYSAFEGGKWSAPAVFANINRPVENLDVGTLKENIFIAYTADSDGDLTTADDIELFGGAIGASASALSDNENAEQNPQFVDWCGMPALVWFCDDSICVYDGEKTVVYDAAEVGIGADFTVENGRVLSVRNGDDGSMLYSSDILDGRIGNPVAITDNAGYIAAFSAESDGSTTYVAFTRRSAVIEENSISKSTDLCIAEIEGFHDLTLLGAEVDEADVTAGATVNVCLTVKNNGLFDEDGILVIATLDGEEKASAVCDAPVAKGDTATLTVNLPLESTLVPQTEYVFSVAPTEAKDRNTADNSKNLILGYADLRLHAELIGSGDGKLALIDVENLSGIDTNAILHIYDDDEEHTQLAALDMGTISAGESELYEIDGNLLPQLCETDRILFFTVESKEEEVLTGDNSTFLYLQSEDNEQTVSFSVSVNGTETEFMCGAYEVSQIAVAVYNETGKMLSVKTVDGSEGSEKIAVTFESPAIPRNCTVKAFLLDMKHDPISEALEKSFISD